MILQNQLEVTKNMSLSLATKGKRRTRKKGVDWVLRNVGFTPEMFDEINRLAVASNRTFIAQVRWLCQIAIDQVNGNGNEKGDNGNGQPNSD